MVRISKQQEKRKKRNPHAPRPPSVKTGPIKDNLPKGFKVHNNAVQGEKNSLLFIPKIK